MKSARYEQKQAKKKFSRPGAVQAQYSPDFVGHTFAVHDGRKHVPYM